MIKQNTMQHSKTTILLFLLLLCSFACTEDTPDFELGRYEYAGIDDKTFRFFRVETGWVFREVTPKQTGIGALREVEFCAEDWFGSLFYDCGLFPAAEKPFFEFSENQVEYRILDSSGGATEFSRNTLAYKLEKDSIFIGEAPFLFKFPKPVGQKQTVLEIPWLLYFAQGSLQSFNLNLVEKNQTDQERLREIMLREQLSTGDTILYCFFKERFEKQ